MGRQAMLLGVGATVLAAAVIGTIAVDRSLEDRNGGSETPGPVLDEAIVAEIAGDAGVVDIHRTAACDCCGGHRDHLVAAGFEVVERVHDAEELARIKQGLGVPDGMWSCHTSVVDGYTVEGHVPADVIATVLSQRPAIDGITLPGMPAGSPGMGGVKNETWTFTSFESGVPGAVFADR